MCITLLGRNFRGDVTVDRRITSCVHVVVLTPCQDHNQKTRWLGAVLKRSYVCAKNRNVCDARQKVSCSF